MQSLPQIYQLTIASTLPWIFKICSDALFIIPARTAGAHTDLLSFHPQELIEFRYISIESRYDMSPAQFIDASWRNAAIPIPLSSNLND